MPLTSAQIVAAALDIVKAPGYTLRAGQFLNMLLQHLAQVYDFDVVRETTTINVSGSQGVGPYNLPADYLRGREVFYTQSGVPFFLTQYPLEQYDQFTSVSGISDYPKNFTTDMSPEPPIIYFWPPPTFAIGITVRYQPQPADIASPETSATVPWFPDQRYLVTQLAADIMLVVDDDRADATSAKASRLLDHYLMSKDDKEGYAMQVSLDRRSFRSNRNLPASKLLGY